MLRQKLEENRAWYLAQLIDTQKLDATLASLLACWRNPVLRRSTDSGEKVGESGVPVRAIVAYLFAEVARSFFLIHRPEEWI